ncbi:tetratricopeptide repeat protein [Candidatus Ruminimicrobium bovinum]|uniref:tetratricopeptide repeat protein n=1 Tax=Candidatus Ruminimicrobium bovinum TaxID=3242779 RepID=UPI0039B82BE5
MKKIINFFKTNLGFLVLITIIVLLLYGKSINYQLLDLDDTKSINQNIEFISNYKNLPKIFFKDCYFDNIHSYYRPVLLLSFAITAVFFQENPKPYHFTNLVLFIFTFYLMYLLLLKLNFNEEILKLIFILFLIHPIFTSNAVYISPRAEMLLLIFSLLSIMNLIDFLKENKRLNLLMTVIFFLFAVFAKETGIMLIPIYMAVIYCFNFKISKKQLIYLCCLLIFPVIIYFYLRSISVPKIEDVIKLENFYFYIENMVSGLIIYLYKIFIPDNIAVILGKTDIKISYIIFDVLLCLFLFYLFYKEILNRKIVVFGIVWFVVMLFPTFFVSDYQFFPHRILTAFLGITVILVSVVDFVVKKYPVSKKYLFVLFLTIFCVYFFASYKQADKYKNSEIFWGNAYLDAPEMPTVLASIGKICIKYGDIENGYKYLKKAVIKNEYYLHIYANDLAIVLFKKGNLKAAERMLWYGFATFSTYDDISTIYTEQGNFEKALMYAKAAYEIKPYKYNFLKLARLYAMNNNFELAKEMLLKVEDKDDDNYYVLAMLYDDLNDKENAIKCIRKAIELKPDDNEKYLNLLHKLQE